MKTNKSKQDFCHETIPGIAVCGICQNGVHCEQCPNVSKQEWTLTLRRLFAYLGLLCLDRGVPGSFSELENLEVFIKKTLADQKQASYQEGFKDGIETGKSKEFKQGYNDAINDLAKKGGKST